MKMERSGMKRNENGKKTERIGMIFRNQSESIGKRANYERITTEND